MRYFTLKANLALRGWCDLKYALLDLNCTTIENRVFSLSEEQMTAIELLTSGEISPDENIVPAFMKRMAEYGLKKGFFVECSKGTQLESYQKYHYTTAKYTHTLLWSITGNCNLNCRHCYIHSGENLYGEITLEKCDEVIRQCLEANVNMIALTGGEPLVRKDFWELVDHILSNHIRILQIFTNGMLVNEKFMFELEKRNINPNYIMLSFDGVACHDWLRGVKGAEEAAIRAIKLVKSHGIRVTVSMALHMGNIDSLLETYELMKELGVDFWKAAPIVETGNWKKQENNSINTYKVFDKYLELITQYKKDDFPFRLGLGGFFQGKTEDTERYMIPFVSGCGACERGEQSLCESTRVFPYLLPDGKVLPCIAMSGSKMEDIAPNIFDEGMNLERAFTESQVEEYTKYTYNDLFAHNPECAACEHRLVCGGCRANALACGGFFEKDPLACHFMKGGYEQKIREIMSGDRGTEACLSD